MFYNFTSNCLYFTISIDLEFLIFIWSIINFIHSFLFDVYRSIILSKTLKRQHKAGSLLQWPQLLLPKPKILKSKLRAALLNSKTLVAQLRLSQPNSSRTHNKCAKRLLIRQFPLKLSNRLLHLQRIRKAKSQWLEKERSLKLSKIWQKPHPKCKTCLKNKESNKRLKNKRADKLPTNNSQQPPKLPRSTRISINPLANNKQLLRKKQVTLDNQHLKLLKTMLQ